jgi:hypothetical protein
MGTVINFPGAGPPGDDPLPVGENAPAGRTLTFEQWYDSEFADWFHYVENLPCDREVFLAELAQIRDRLNGWVIP